jgi:hypothetical protein
MRPKAPQVLASGGTASVSHALFLASLISAGTATGCLTHQTPAGKATDAARELNGAMRWGRTDVAIERSLPEDRPEFLKRHAGWGTTQRILESEVTSLQMLDPTHAVVHVDVSWLLDDDTNLRVTRLEQKWSDASGKWVLEEEKRVGGADGLFGEEVERADEKKDKHFPTKVIR